MREEELLHAHRAYEAHAGGVGFFCRLDAARTGGGTYLVFARELPDGKQRAREGGTGHAPQEIGLVLVFVCRAEQPARGVCAGVVAGRDEVGAAPEGLAREAAEFHLLVAHYVWVGGAPVRVGVEQVVHDLAFVLVFVVPHLQVDAQLYGDAFGIG